MAPSENGTAAATPVVVGAKTDVELSRKSDQTDKAAVTKHSDGEKGGEFGSAGAEKKDFVPSHGLTTEGSCLTFLFTLPITSYRLPLLTYLATVPFVPMLLF